MCRPTLRAAQMSRARIAASATSGSNSARIESRIEPVVSTVLTMGLPKPAVATPVFARTTAVLPFVAPAMPPPAMIAIGHIKAGFTSVMTDALAMTPATIATGAREHVEDMIDAGNVVRERLEQRGGTEHHE